jgi:hypothetical protein
MFHNLGLQVLLLLHLQLSSPSQTKVFSHYKTIVGLISLLTLLLLPLPTTSFSIQITNNNNIMTTTEKYLTPITPEQVKLEIKDPVDPTALSQAKDIISELRSSSNDTNGNISSSVIPSNLIKVAQRLNDIPSDSNKFFVTKEECKAAYDNLDATEKKALDNIHARVKAFAEAQRKSVTDMEIDIPGGKAGHTVSPCKGWSSFIVCKITMSLIIHF